MLQRENKKSSNNLSSFAVVELVSEVFVPDLMLDSL